MFMITPSNISHTYHCVPCGWRAVIYAFGRRSRFLAVSGGVESRLVNVQKLATRDVQRTHGITGVAYWYVATQG